MRCVLTKEKLTSFPKIFVRNEKDDGQGKTGYFLKNAKLFYKNIYSAILNTSLTHTHTYTQNTQTKENN